MRTPVLLLVFQVEGWRVGVPLDAVLRVERACAITPLPGAPTAVCGIVELAGRIAAVVDMRRRLGQPARTVAPDDAFAFVDTGGRLFALQADDVEGVLALTQDQLVPADDVADGLVTVQGVARTRDGLLLVEDPGQFLDVRDMARLDRAIATLDQAGAS